MPELLREVAEASQHANPAWSPARERAVRERIEGALGRRRATSAFAIAAAGLAVVALLVIGVWKGPGLGVDPPLRAAPASAPRLLTLDDGSRVTSLSGDARVTPIEVGPSAATIRLESGAARFEVTRHDGRRFRVLARDVSVTVLGTVFEVRADAGGVRVRVERGRVEVAWAGERRELGPGQEIVRRVEARPASAVTATGSPAPPGSAPSANGPEPPSQDGAEAPPASDERPAPSGGAPSLRAPKAGPSWRDLARDSDYAGAFARMTAEGPNAVQDRPDDLFLAADVARLSGHPELAIPKLTRLVKAHGQDSRAPLAAFTLGRTLLDALGRPREAAEAFALVRRLAPGGAMSQDALAREVESWSRAGESDLARERAEQYLERYPNGRRQKAVRYHGGLE